MPEPPCQAADRDAFSLTSCYAADKCQLDLGCPFHAGCQIARYGPAEDD